MARKIVGCGQRIFLYGLLFMAVCMFPMRAYAADAVTAFGSAAYTAEAGGGEDVAGASFAELLNGLETGGRNTGQEAGELGGTGREPGELGGMGQETGETRQKLGELGETEQGLAGSGVAESAGSWNLTGTGHNASTAESIYENSRREVIENDRDRMLRRFLYFVIFFTVAVLLAFIIMKIRSAIKKERQELDGSQDEPETFLFEFETIPEEKPEESWQQQIREDIDAREREGRNTQTLRFRRVNDSEYDLEVNELDYDMEVEYLDMGIEYMDIGQE